MSEDRNEIEIVRQAGGRNPVASETHRGICIWWTDPVTGTTLTMYAHEIHCLGDVTKHINESRIKFKEAKRAG